MKGLIICLVILFLITLSNEIKFKKFRDKYVCRVAIHHPCPKGVVNPVYSCTSCDCYCREGGKKKGLIYSPFGKRNATKKEKI